MTLRRMPVALVVVAALVLGVSRANAGASSASAAPTEGASPAAAVATAAASEVDTLEETRPVATATVDPGQAGVVPTPPLTQVGAGQYHSCGVANDSRIFCWGDDLSSALGINGAGASLQPVAVLTAGTPLAGRAVAQLAVGYQHTCVLATDDTLACWGKNVRGQLGNGTTTEAKVPVAVTKTGTPLDGKDIVQISAGGDQTCAVTSDGSAACWGYNADGQLGNGTTTSSSVPVAVTRAGTPLEGGSITSISAGYRHTCASTAGGAAACWGYNSYGQLGNDSTTSSPLPVGFAPGALSGRLVSEISAGGLFSCARASDGTLACWGYGGQLGTGSYGSSKVPVAVTITGTPLAGRTVAQIDAGDSHTCARATDSTLVCWGDNVFGQIGRGDDSGSALLPNAVTVAGTPLQGKALTQVSTGNDHSCALSSDGVAACWGINWEGQVGNGTQGESGAPSPFSPGVLAGKTAASLSLGGHFTCGLATDSGMGCWGWNNGGTLGNGTYSTSWTPTAVVIAGTPLAGRTIAEISSGESHSCARATDSTLACWGNGGLGQLGNNGSSLAPVPEAVVVSGTPLAGRSISQLSLGGSHSCVLATDSAVLCWGYNSSGQLGNGTTSLSRVAVEVSRIGTALAGKSVTQIAAGDRHTCALANDSTIACWGYNTWGQLGTGTSTSSSVPVAVVTAGTPLAGKTITGITAGDSHTCALASDGTIACWGYNSGGQLGNGTTTASSLPVAVTRTGTPLAGAAITRIDAGSDHTCALTGAGAVACWGGNVWSQVGLGEPTSTAKVPVALPTLGNPLQGLTVARIDAGADHTCAIATDGTVSCWGSNSFGELGNGIAGYRPVPTGLAAFLVLGLPGAPTVGTATAGDRSATVTWTPPTANGGAPVTGYVITPYIGGVAQTARTATGSATSREIVGLTNGTTYTFRVAATNAVGTGAQSGDSNPVTPGPPPQPYRPFASWDAFVSQQMLDFTGSRGTTASRAPYVSQLSSSAITPAGFIESRMNGTWFAGATAPVARLYWAYFGRIPDYSGLTYWAGRYRAGTSLNSISQGFAGSAEFQATYGSLSNSAFVMLVYQNVLGRPPDGAGLAYWTAQLNSGKKTRGQVMVGFSESAEYKTKMATRVTVVMVYAGLLHRKPTTGELTSGIAQSAGTLIETIRLGTEYDARIP